MAAGLLFLVCAAAVLYSAEAWRPYNGLPEIYKKGVNLVRQELTTHSKIRHRYQFLKSVDKLETESGFDGKYIYHHFLLKPTIAPQLLMDCVICYKAIANQIKGKPEPYVHCIQRQRLTEEMKKTRLGHYRNMIYYSGAPTLFALTAN
ncbi:uncharacterized protein LOC143420519 [Maylandia zebra]|uniref:uncharacterized protein LOC143420519 n=1 Tax=Maylandia zebra TaxID=106582 RepID=UPI00403C4C66